MVAAEVDFDAPALVRRALEEQALILNATGPGTLRFLPPLVVRRPRSRRRCGGWAAARLSRWITTGWPRRCSSRRAHAEPPGDGRDAVLAWPISEISSSATSSRQANSIAARAASVA